MNPVTATHIHLILSHAPIAAIFIGFSLLAYGVWRGSRDIQKAALALFVAAAVLAVPSYLTGEPGAGMVKGLPGYSDQLLEQHRSAAGVTLAACAFLGTMALAGLILSWGKTITRWFGVVLLAGALLAGGLTAWTANLGGQIRHSEIRAHDAGME